MKQNQSIQLTKLLIYVALALVFMTIAFAPKIVSIYLLARQMPSLYPSFYVGIAILSILATIILLLLRRLILNIEKEEIFIEENICYLKTISVCFVIASIACIGLCLFYIPWLFIAIASAFMAVIIRVIKNVFEKAQEIKQENDLTV